MDKIKLPAIPKFMFSADAKNNELFIVHTQNPIALIWVKQTIPAQLFIVKSEMAEENPEFEKVFSPVLLAAANWYRQNAINKTN